MGDGLWVSLCRILVSELASLETIIVETKTTKWLEKETVYSASLEPTQDKPNSDEVENVIFNKQYLGSYNF